MGSGDHKTGHEVAGAARDKLKQREAGPWRQEVLRKSETLVQGDLYKRDMSKTDCSGSKGLPDGKGSLDFSRLEKHMEGPRFLRKQR